MQTIAMKDKRMLGDNIKKYIRKQSNPQTLRPLQKYSLGSVGCQNSQTLITPFTPHNNQSQSSFKDSLDQSIKKNKFNFSNKLKMMLSKHHKTISSRLFAQDQRGLSLANLVNNEHNQTRSSFGRATKYTRFNRFNHKVERDNPRSKKLQQLFSPKIQIKQQPAPHPMTHIKHSKTKSYFYNTEKKPWHTVRVNNQVVIFDIEKSPKSSRNRSIPNELSFYRTLYK